MICFSQCTVNELALSGQWRKRNLNIWSHLVGEELNWGFRVGDLRQAEGSRSALFA